MKCERIKDYLLMEQEFIENQERYKPAKDKEEEENEDNKKIEAIRGTPMMFISNIFKYIYIKNCNYNF